MSKKKKIIISSVVVGVVLIGIILTLVLVNIKRFDMKASSKYEFNKHTEMVVIERDTSYTYYGGGSLYKGGTEIVKKNSTGKMGVYSYIENKNVVEPIFDDVSIVTGNTTTTKSYFRCNLSTAGKMVKIVDETGEDVSFLKYDEDEQITTSYIKSRTVDLTQSKNSVKTKINKKYHNEEIKVSNASLLSGSSTYKCCYTDNETYNYEIWELTTTDNQTYINLYEIADGEHVLIQTLNNQLGVSLESKDLELAFLTDGTPILLGENYVTYNSDIQSVEFEIYDINFNLKGKSQLNSNVLTHTESEFRVGDYLVFQTKLDATEDKYDYFETSTLGTKYYTINTFKLNLKNADIMEVSFNYKIQSVTTSFNTKTALIYAQKIKNKQLSSSEILLINSRMQTKVLDYSFNSITQINDNRYIAYTLGNGGTKSNFHLIDKNYNIVAHLEDFSEIYATSNALIVNDDTSSYICNFDGVVIKKMSKDEFTYLFDDSYYLVEKQVSTESGNVNEYYLENLGLTQENFLYSESDSGYFYNSEEVDNVIIVNTQYATLIITVKASGDLYTYNVYNTDGTHLGVINDVTDREIAINKMYSDDNHTVLKVDTKYVVLDR